MTAKAVAKKEELCMEKELAIDLVGMTEGLIESMTRQQVVLYAKGYDTTNIEEQIKSAKTRLRTTKRRLKK